jgi:hypothetical protein
MHDIPAHGAPMMCAEETGLARLGQIILNGTANVTV